LREYLNEPSAPYSDTLDDQFASTYPMLAQYFSTTPSTSVVLQYVTLVDSQ
jgi:hypothetical protein